MSYETEMANALAAAEADADSVHRARLKRLEAEQPSQRPSAADLVRMHEDEVRSFRKGAVATLAQERDELPTQLLRALEDQHHADTIGDVDGEAMYAREVERVQARMSALTLTGARPSALGAGPAPRHEVAAVGDTAAAPWGGHPRGGSKLP
jgi:hypothetical protein